MAVQYVNPDGTGETRDGFNQRVGNAIGGSMSMPETKDAIYGAFGNILNFDKEEENTNPYVYNVYQNIAQEYDTPQNLQYTYGTASNPVFEWVKRIQSGTRTYNPQDDFDNSMLEEYKKQYGAGDAGAGALSPDELMKQAGIQTAAQVVGQAAGRVGQAMVDPYLEGDVWDKGYEGLKTTFYGDLPSETIQANTIVADDFKLLDKNELIFNDNLSTLDAAKASGEVDAYNELASRRFDLNKGVKGTDAKYAYKPLKDGEVDLAQTAGSGEIVVGGTNAIPMTGGERVTSSLDWTSPTGKANWSGAGAAGLASGITTFVMTGDVEKGVKTGLGTTLGKAAGTALGSFFGPAGASVGGFIGGMVGGAIGGRVICNELHNQGLITKKQLINDYKFTRDYLTTKHVNGYHLWALWMVKQMRKGKYVNFWKHIVLHRANEIAYIYGETDKPDYLGKIYRKIFEPICWTLGLFCKETDWSILYKTKEI